MSVTTSEAIVWLVQQAGRADGSFSNNENMDVLDHGDYQHHVKEAKSSGMEARIRSGELSNETAIQAVLAMSLEERKKVIEYCRVAVKSDGTNTDSENHFIQELASKLGL